MTWQLGVALNAVIGTSYLIITWLILRGLWRTHQATSNTLALATAMIFFTCGVHHGGHAVHALLPSFGIDKVHGLAMREAFTWQMDAWDVVGAVVAVFYLSLRRAYGRLLDQPEMFENTERQRYEERIERERAALAEAQALANVGSWEWDLEQSYSVWSDELCRIFGQPLGFSPTYEQFLVLVHPADRHSFTGDRNKARRSAILESEYRIVRPDGEVRFIRSRRHERIDADGERVQLFGTMQDITEAKLIWAELETVNARLQAVLEHSPSAIYMRDLDERFVLANRRTAEILGNTPDGLLGRTIEEVMPRELAMATQHDDREVIGGNRPVQYEERIPGARDLGRPTAHLTMKFPVHDRAGRTIGVGGVSLEITERVAAEQALRAAESRLRATIDHAPIGVALIDLDPSRLGHVVSANDALCTLLGRPCDALLETSLPALVHPDDADAVERDLRLLATDEQARTELEVRCLPSDGRVVWALLSGAAVSGGEPDTRYAVFHALDIGERKRFEAQLRHLADHDALTGLYNRRRFEEELVRAVALAERYGHPGAVLLIDLDGFKYVNDSLGHSYGDQLVTRVGSLLHGALRDTDVVARLGGDEFAVILPHTDAQEALSVCEKILGTLQEQAIVLTESRHARVTASIGVTVFDRETELTAEELLVEADIAMYEAKENGKNRASVYVREHDHRAGLLARQSWLERLKEAIADERFELMAQPVLGICAEANDRYELLLRLRGDNDELIPPGTFLYIAERFNLIQQIDRWVFAQAAHLLNRFSAAGRDICLSVNMSGKTISDPDVLNDIRSILQRHPVPPDRLIVEVTETAAIVNIDKAREVARGLRELGCRFALDDFGAGFASFFYLKHLEFDYLKIDGEFIKNVNHNATDQLVVRSVVQIAHGLGARTIAEFVGDEHTVTRLRALGIDYGQGYYLGRPEPISAVLPVPV